MFIWSLLPLCSVLVYHRYIDHGGARGVMVIVIGNGHGDMSSIPGHDWLHFTLH